MKRYMVFLYPQYYPRGGMGDFNNSFNTLEEILIALNLGQGIAEYNSEEFGDVFDLEERRHVKTLSYVGKGKWAFEDVV